MTGPTTSFLPFRSSYTAGELSRSSTTLFGQLDGSRHSLPVPTSDWRIGNEKRARIHEYLSFRAAVETDAGTAAAAHTDESKVRVARYSPGIVLSGDNLWCPVLGTEKNSMVLPRCIQLEDAQCRPVETSS